MSYTGAATTNTGMSALMQTYFDKLGLERLVPMLVLYQLGEKKPLPMNSGKSIVFHRYYGQSTQVSAFALTEGTPPTAGSLSATSVTATILQYGHAVQTTDLLEMTAISDVVKDAIENLGQHAGEIIERKTFQVVYGSSSIPSGATFPIQYGSDVVGALSTLTSAYPLTVKDLRIAVTNLKKLYVQPHTGSDYVLVAHPQTVRVSLMGDSEWQAANQYTTSEAMKNGEAGRIAGVRVVESPLVPNTTSGVGTASQPVYFSLLLGRGAFGVTEINGGFKVLVVRPNQYDSTNMLQQYTTIGWKANFVPVVLNTSCASIIATAD